MASKKYFKRSFPSQSSTSSSSSFTLYLLKIIQEFFIFWFLFICLILLILIIIFNHQNPKDEQQSATTTTTTTTKIEDINDDRNSENFHTIDLQQNINIITPNTDNDNHIINVTNNIDAMAAYAVDADDGVRATTTSINIKNDFYDKLIVNDGKFTAELLNDKNTIMPTVDDSVATMNSNSNENLPILNYVEFNDIYNYYKNLIGNFDSRIPNNYTKNNNGKKRRKNTMATIKNSQKNIINDERNYEEFVGIEKNTKYSSSSSSSSTNRFDSNTKANINDTENAFRKNSTNKPNKPFKVSWHVVENVDDDDYFNINSHIKMKDVFLKYHHEDDIDDQNLNEHEKEQKKLSRMRRYLTFPEGTSFQIVWDGIIPIVDYTNYLILGVTLALAWALPSEPPSELLDNVVDRLNNGTLGLRRQDDDPDEKIYRYDEYYKMLDRIKTPETKKPNDLFHPPLRFDDPGVMPNSLKWDPQYYQNKYNKYDGKWNNQSWSRINDNIKGYNQAYQSNNRNYNNMQWNKYNNKKYNDYNDHYHEKHQHHHIIPVFGKRKKRDTRKYYYDPLQIVDILYHRQSRFSFFQKLERFITELGQNGTECLLKAICETGQREYDEYNKPANLVDEILISLFTIPQPIDDFDDAAVYKAGVKYKLYDAAHAEEGNCTELYSKCQGSVWDEDFLN